MLGNPSERGIDYRRRKWDRPPDSLANHDGQARVQQAKLWALPPARTPAEFEDDGIPF
ncbi:hypothetical protein MASR1M8_06480 [Thermomonas brevis]